ncbi:MAG: flavin monoamine oxidase family protein [Gammaproteobacteria bacterium]
MADPDDLIAEGFGTFVAQYGAGVPVRLNSPVMKIVYRDGKVVVETSKGEGFEGLKALVTVSTGVLAAKKIVFEPDLPEAKKEAIRNLPMGVMNKVIFEFNDNIFPRGLGGRDLDRTWVLFDGRKDNRGEETDMAWVFLKVPPKNAYIAIGFFGGDQAKELEKQGEGAMISRAMTAMKKMCNCDAEGKLVKKKVTMWGLNPWTLGAYSAAKPGASGAHEEMARPIGDLVYFAGEACSTPTFNGSFAGAYYSALKAGHAIIRRLNDEDKARTSN